MLERRESGVDEECFNTHCILDPQGNPLRDCCGYLQVGPVHWSDEVTNLDQTSDYFDVFGISVHLRWKGVEMECGRFRAPNLDVLIEFLTTHAWVAGWNPLDL